MLSDIDGVAERNGEIAPSARHGFQRPALPSIAAEFGFRRRNSVAAGAIEFGAMMVSTGLNDSGEATLILGAAAVLLLSSRSIRSAANRPARQFDTLSTTEVRHLRVGGARQSLWRFHERQVAT
jgi:hypothetical protein